MKTAEDQELRSLRARAYGPAADIHDDPAAVRRLRELEERRNAPRSPREVVDQEEQEGQERLGAAAHEAAHAAAHGEEADQERSTQAPPALMVATPTVEASTRASSGLRPERRTLLWGASVLVSAALAAGTTYAIVSVAPVATSSGAPQVAALEPSATAPLPVGWFGVGPSSTVYEFYGLTVFRSASAYDRFRFGSGGDCLSVVRTDQVPDVEQFDSTSWSFDGQMYTGCAVGGFPAAVAVAFDSNAPKELTERFPAGRALQFVLDGDRVGVFLDSE